MSPGTRRSPAGSAPGARPSRVRMPSSSLLPQRSASLPSTKVLICMPRIYTDLPVGALRAVSDAAAKAIGWSLS